MNYLTWVVKFSKLCNLRCGYCYELPFLSDRSKISEKSLEHLFSRIVEVSSYFGCAPKICWHGGEPLMLGKEYISSSMETLKRVAPDSVNILQTNLYQDVTDWLPIFNEFDHISVSLDAFSDDRIHVSGKQSTDKVLSNMEKLRHAGIKHGVITVLSSKTASTAKYSYELAREAGLPIRFLPYYRLTDQTQVGEYGLDGRSISETFIEISEAWLKDGMPIFIMPLAEYVHAAANYVTKRNFRIYDKEKREHVLIVEPNGDVFSVADATDEQFRYGNLLNDTPNQIIESAGRWMSIQEAQSRVLTICGSCSFAGACSTYPVGEATPVQRASLHAQDDCQVVKTMVQYFVDKLREGVQLGEVRGWESGRSLM